MISRPHFEKVTGYIEYARQQGHTIHCGGAAQLTGRVEKVRTFKNSFKIQKRLKCLTFFIIFQGYFVRPTVISGVPSDSRLIREEIFGPVVVVVPFDNADEVVQLVNSVDYGLSASVWSKQVDNINSVANRLRVGTVWCNCWLVSWNLDGT